MAILVKDGYLLTNDARRTVYPRASILIENDRIKAIATDAKALGASTAPGLEIIDASRSLILPGFVNAHMHSNESFEQGAYDNMPLELWLLHKYPPFATPVLTRQEQYLRTMLCAIRSVRSGVTSLQDDLISAGNLHAIDGACAAYRDVGLRAWVTVNLSDRHFAEPLPWLDELMPADLLKELANIPRRSWKDQIGLFQEAYARWHGSHDLIRILLGPVGPQWCSTELLQAITEASNARDVPVHMHCLETKTQEVTAQQLYGKPAVEFLREIGFLTPRVTLNHAIWLNDREIEWLGEHSCSITHNPLSNLKLGSGLCPVRKLLSAGVNVALGTDGMSTSDTADIFTALNAAALLHRSPRVGYDQWITAEQAYQMSTTAGARSGLMQHEVGSLEVGKKADLILLDRQAWSLIPLHHPIQQLAFSTTSDVVHTSIINGKVVMRNRVLTQIDEDGLRQDVSAAAEQFLATTLPTMTAGARRFEPYLKAIHERAMQTARIP